MANWLIAGDAILPAQLAFLTIYNPSFGQSDDTLHDQVLYYYSSKSSRSRRQRKTLDEDSDQRQNEDRNERLRQIGLAQGMVEFAKCELQTLVDHASTRLIAKLGPFLTERTWTL